MSDMRGRLAAFVPRTLWPLLKGDGKSARRDGCVLFADVAGFTPLTEGLARIGKEGAEELVRILNDFFEAMIGIAHEEGGDVLRFGGDAMTLFFPKGTGSGLRAAIRMQSESRRFGAIETRGGTFPLAMKVGVSSGPVLLGVVGDDAVGRDYFAAGSALDLSAEAEHHAEKGMVALCPRCVGRLEGNLKGLEVLPDGFGLLRTPLQVPLGILEGCGAPAEAASAPEEGELIAFLPTFIREKAALPQGLLVAEHRRTTTLFLAFKGLDYEGDPEVAGKVAAVYAEIAGAVQRYGGTVNKVDMGDKGSKALCLFGTPVALEHQEEMGCRAAMEILESRSLRAIVQDLKIGVTTAPVFAAYVGCDERREYTVMGDGINLAARLMANSFAWKMLASKEVFDQASDALEFRALDPIFVKGKADKVPIYRPEGEKDQSGASPRSKFVGRQEILDEILAKLGEAETPVAVAVTGEAGVGKTAFLGRLRQGLDRLGVRYTLVPLASYSATTYMSAWRPVLSACLGVGRSEPEEIKAEALRAALTAEDSEYLPLFNALLDMELPETPSVKALGAKDRKDLTFAILARLIASQAEKAPYAVLLDQVESADPASLEFMQTIVGEASGVPLKIVCAVRSGAPKPISDATASLKPVMLEPLAQAEIREYLVRIVGVRVPPESLLDFAAKRTRGNPKFLEQVTVALRKEGILYEDRSGALRVDEERLASTSFPDTLEGLLLSRVEGLPEAEKHLLKAAAVLGSSFSLGLLGAVLGEETTDLRERVRPMEASGLIRTDSWGARPYATFTDTLMREALYESLNFALKRQVHRRAWEFLEAERGGDAAIWPILAHHCDAAGDGEKAAEYFWKAAQDARSRYDNASTFAYFDRFVALRESAGADPGKDEAFRQALLHLGEAFKNLGRLDEADLCCQKILDGTKRLSPERVTALRRIADNHRLRGDMKMSLDLYRLAMLQARKLGDQLQEAWILVDSSVPLAMSGRFKEAMVQLGQAESLAGKIKASGPLVYALMNQGLCLYHGSGDCAGAAGFFRRARSVAHRSRLKPNLVAITVNLAQALFDLGEYRKALDMAKEGAAIAKQFGYRVFLASSLSNMALYQTILGLVEEAHQTSSAALAISRQHGIHYRTGLSLHTAGILLAHAGDYENALKDQVEAMRTLLGMQATGEAVSCLSETLAVANQLGTPKIAEAILEEFQPRLGEEAQHESKASSLGFQVQWTLFSVIRATMAPGEADAAIMLLEEKAKSMKLWWLCAEAAEARLALLSGQGDWEAAARAGGDQYETLAGHYCPFKVNPFMVSYAEALHRIGDEAHLRSVLALLKRHERGLDRGLLGVRYHWLASCASMEKGAVAAGRGRRAHALRMIYRVSVHLTDPLIKKAFFALSAVRDVLKGDEMGMRSAVAPEEGRHLACRAW